MNRIRTGRPGARSGRPWPGALSPGLPDPGIVRATGARADRAFRNGARDMLAWAGPLRWVPSLGGYRLEGSQVPPQDPSETGR